MRDTIRDGIFTVVSVVTTTGFATVDFGAWPVALEIMVLGLMFVGGMAGSTGRLREAVPPRRPLQASRADLKRVVHPRGVFVVRLGKDPVPDEIVESVQSFFLLYMFAFMTGTMLVGIFEQSLGLGNDLVTSASAVASSLGQRRSGTRRRRPVVQLHGRPRQHQVGAVVPDDPRAARTVPHPAAVHPGAVAALTTSDQAHQAATGRHSCCLEPKLAVPNIAA